MSQPGQLSGKRALVTGSTSGIGLGIARAMAGEGADLVISGFGDADEITALCTELGAKHVDADLLTEEGCEKLMADAGPVDILVNNAGIVRVADPTEHFSNFFDTDPANWQKQFDLNVFGVMNGAKAVLPGMRERQWGRFVTVSSDSGRKGGEGLSIYGAATSATAPMPPRAKPHAPTVPSTSPI